MYLLSKSDKKRVAKKISDSLLYVPVGEMKEVLSIAKANVEKQEFGDDSYEYCRSLIKIIEERIKEKDWNYFGLFFVSNHGHSGWIECVDRVYFSPRNKVEKGLSLQLEALIMKAIKGFISEPIPDVLDTLFFFHLEMSDSLLDKLGRECPKELITDYRDFVLAIPNLRDLSELSMGRDVVRTLIRRFEKS